MVSSQRQIVLSLVRAFTSHPQGGNPAGVVQLATAVADEGATAEIGAIQTSQLQQLAAQSAQPVTAFVWPVVGGYQIRWFTPSMEINLCGHGTLAAAAVLFSQQAQRSRLQFYSAYGEMTVERSDTGLCLQLPCFALQSIAVSDLPHKVTQGLTIAAAFGRDLILELANADAVRAYQPDFTAMRQLSWHAVLVTALSETAAVEGTPCYVLRYFAPSIGIDEDPATGSAHCSLLPYWQAKKPQPEQRWRAQQYSNAGGDFVLQQQGSVLRLTSQAVLLGQRQLDWPLTNSTFDR
jgi:predicted PhzF superfamily epimerase YddE/YHI9